MGNVIYNRGGDIIEIKIKDSMDRIIDKFKFNAKDKETCDKVMTFVLSKYGIHPSANMIEQPKKKIKKKEEMSSEEIDNWHFK
jgi:hypothetical protein